jgi:O-antigen/teichoic acid export membrane protein
MLENLKAAIKSTAIYSLGNLTSKLLGIILIPLYTSKLSLAEYGMLGMLEISVQILTAIIGLSLYNAFFRWFWDKQYLEKQKSIFFTILVFVFTGSIMLNLLFLPFHDQLSSLLLDTDQQGYLIMLILIIAGLEAIAIVISTLVRLQERPGFYTFLYIVKVLTNLSFTVYFIVVKGKKIDGIYEAQLIGNAVFFILAARFVIKNSTPKIEWKIIPGMLKFSYPLLFSSIAGIILTISDRYVLKFISDLAYVGIYTLGYKIASTLRVFVITSVNLAIQPMIYKMIDQPDNKRFYSKIMTYYSFGLMICVLGLSLFGQELIKLLSKANPEYWEAFSIVPIISMSFFFGMLRDVSLTGINISKKTVVNARSILVAATLNIGLNIVLIPVFGYMGAAVATLISQLLYFLIIYYFAQKYYPIKYEIPKVIKIIGAGILIYVLSIFTNEMTLLPRLLIKSALILSFPFILYILRFYESIELESLRGLWIKWRNPGKWLSNLRSLK